MALPTEKPSYGPLDGVKVVYAAVELACPKAADLMADWGADVVWLENTGAGDTIRDTPYIKQAERRNQRSVALNYFSEEGKKVFFDLVRDADIFMEASKGGTWARKGITDEVLWELNPKLVIVHVSGFGQEGDPKMVKRAAYDLTVMAYSGIIMQNGTEEQPMLPGPYAGDYFNTLMIASSALAALYQAEKSGKGESIDLAMYETLLAIGQYYLVDYLNEGIKWPRPGARNQNLCGIGEFKCKDGFLGVCLYGVDQNKYFLETIGLGHLWGTEDIPEDTSGLWLSNPHADEIQKAFEEYCLANSKYDIEEDFAAHRIAAQVVSGISFLGAGVIFKNGNSIRGLTTAAGMWGTAAVGMAIGAGMYWVGLIEAAVLVGIQIVLHRFPVGADALTTQEIVVEMTDSDELLARFDALVKSHRGQITESSLTRQNGILCMEVTAKLDPPITHEEALAFMKANDGVRRVSV